MKLTGYDREKYIAELLGVRAVPFSGSRFDAGREDLESATALYQVKSTLATKLTVDFRDIFSLRQHAQSKRPVFVLDFVNPVLHTPGGVIAPGEDIWVALPVQDYLLLRDQGADRE